MSWVAVAVAGSSVVGAVVSSDASRKASNTQADAAERAAALANDQWAQTREDNMPALEARNASLAKMREMLGISGTGAGTMSSALTARQVQAEPGYQFGLDQGQQAMQRQANARGMLNSGNALLAASRYGNDYATTKYGDSWNRLQGERANSFNRLASVAGLGQTGASQIGQSGQTAALNAGNNMMSAANAQAAGGLAQANTWVNTGNQLAGWYSRNNTGNTNNSSGWAGGYNGTNDGAVTGSGSGYNWWLANGTGAD